ncbi:MAG TPA: hypothetical protein VME18_10640 [Acidobacteriaceae bacterium]|nr:hypothetical protein [Acidobacteriaceae bacterium]
MEARVYYFRRSVQCFYFVIGLWFIGSAAFLACEMPSVLIAMILGLPGIYAWLWAMRSRLTVSGSEISVRYASGEDSAQISEIKGWRKEFGDENRSGWVLRLQDTARSLRIDRDFAVDDFFLDFIARLKDLNEPETSVVR